MLVGLWIDNDLHVVIPPDLLWILLPVSLLASKAWHRSLKEKEAFRALIINLSLPPYVLADKRKTHTDSPPSSSTSIPLRPLYPVRPTRPTYNQYKGNPPYPLALVKLTWKASDNNLSRGTRPQSAQFLPREYAMGVALTNIATRSKSNTPGWPRW